MNHERDRPREYPRQRPLRPDQAARSVPGDDVVSAAWLRRLVSFPLPDRPMADGRVLKPVGTTAPPAYIGARVLGRALGWGGTVGWSAGAAAATAGTAARTAAGRCWPGR